MRYVVASSLCLLGAFGAMLFLPLETYGGIVANTFILAATVLLFYGTLNLNKHIKR